MDVILFMAPGARTMDQATLKRALLCTMTRAKQCVIICGSIQLGQVQ